MKNKIIIAVVCFVSASVFSCTTAPPTSTTPAEPPTPTVTLNPVQAYAEENNLSSMYVDILKPLGEDNTFDYGDMKLVKSIREQLDIFKTYAPSIMIQADERIQSMVREMILDKKVTDEELNTLPDLDQDGTSNKDELSVYKTDSLVAERWDDFDTVTKILDTPEKVGYWMMNNIEYVYAVHFGDVPRVTFYRKTGQCADYARLAAYILSNGTDYEAEQLSVREFSDLTVVGHIVCEYEDKDGKFYYFDTGLKYQTDIVHGPFDTKESLARDVCHKHQLSYEGYELYDINNTKISSIYQF